MCSFSSTTTYQQVLVEFFKKNSTLFARIERNSKDRSASHRTQSVKLVMGMNTLAQKGMTQKLGGLAPISPNGER